MKAELISVGTELLLGQIVDTNAAFLASELPALGIDCYFISQVGDNLDRLVDTLRRAAARSDLVLMTGGLGPTEDDLTREAIASFLGETMVVQPDLEAQLRARFARLGRVMPDTNIKQATLIPSAAVLANPIGTAPGWWVEAPVGPAGETRRFALMPGVPSEMRRMWEFEVKPRLLNAAGGMVIASRTLKVLGLGESHAEARIRRLLSSTNPTIGTYAKQDGIHLRLTAKAADRQAALALIEPVEREIRGILGEAVYGIDSETPQGIVCNLLAERGLTLAAVEYGVAGALTALLDEAMGSRGCYNGGLSVSARAALHPLADSSVVGELPAEGPVSAQGVAWLAGLARRRIGADIGLALAAVLVPGTGEPQAVGTISVALDDGAGPARTAGLSYATAVTEMRRQGALAAVNLLRLHLLEHWPRTGPRS